MLWWALIFFIIAIVAGVFGFTGVQTAAIGVAKVLFWIFIALFLVALVVGLFRRGPAD